MNQISRWLGLHAALAVGYFGLASVGLALALPPGFVSAIWPAAGFAFAVTMVWGISRTGLGLLVGSMVTNATVGGGFHLDTVAVAIAVGSTLQAAVGSAWLHRELPDLALDDSRKVLRFVRIGMLSCLLAASVGNLTLLVHGYIGLAQVPQSFITWWMGDALGVQIFAPLTLLVLAPNTSWKQRRLSVGLPLLLSFMLAGGIYYYVSAADKHQLQRSFAAGTDAVVGKLQTMEATHGQALMQLANGYSVRNDLPDQEFLILAGQIQRSLQVFRVVSWAPVDASGAKVRMMYPVQGNEAAQGFDLLGDPVRAEAVRRALETGQLSVSEPVKLVQDPQGPGAMLLVAPVRNANVRGVVSAVVDLRMLDKALDELPGSVWELRVRMPNGQDRVAWASSQVKMPVFSTDTFLDRAGVYRQQRLTLGGREWHLLLHRPHSKLVGEAGNNPLLVLMLALIACGVVTTFALIRSTEHERITAEVQEKTQALEQSTASAHSANLAKSQFLATMSHEIRTPMNGILGMAQLLMLDGVDDAKRKEYVRTILGSGKTLLAILNDILDLSKIEAQKMELSLSPFDADALVEETSALFRETAQAKGLTLVVRAPGNGQRYMGDAIRLRQMLSNYLGNAVKFSQSGEIEVGYREVGEGAQGVVLEFFVRDQGMGIAQDKVDALFHPFIQVDGSATRRFGGTGLGLSIVRRLAQLMQGDVGVESQEGAGSRFWFQVCCQRVAPGVDVRHVVRADHVSAEVPTADNTAPSNDWVLVVDDNPINRMVAQGMLAQLGATVRCANDGQQALDLLAEHKDQPPSLVLMDCQMPVMDGYAATRAIRLQEAQTGATRLRIVALTAGAFATDREDCIAAGMDDFLSKPLALDDLARVVRAAA